MTDEKRCEVERDSPLHQHTDTVLWGIFYPSILIRLDGTEPAASRTSWLSRRADKREACCSEEIQDVSALRRRQICDGVTQHSVSVG
jgi:hypothetical protein